MTYYICPKNCGQWSADLEYKRFCSEHGDELVLQKTHDCGYRLEPYYKFCPKCGQKLEQEVTHDLPTR